MAEDKREPTRALDKASRVMDALAAENGLYFVKSVFRV